MTREDAARLVAGEMVEYWSHGESKWRRCEVAEPIDEETGLVVVVDLLRPAMRLPRSPVDLRR